MGEQRETVRDNVPGASHAADPQGGLRGWKRLLPVVVLAVGMAAFFAFGLDDHISFAALHDHRDLLRGWVADYPVLTRAGYALLYTLCIAFSLPIGLILTLAGGFLFGLIEGTLITVLAATLGAVMVFLAARTALGDSLRARAGPFLAKLRAGFQENALSYLFVLRLVPLFPFWLVNIVPAMLGVPLRVFTIGTLFGIVPGTLVFVSIGNGLDALVDQGSAPGLGVFLEPSVLIPIAGLILLSLLPVVYKRLRADTADPT
ncbi:MAG: TVP38/TMEM64 family protein [Alphaproteobacteria bacterium]|nr:TVP38/TMEM64 family protein [Alphaproteobacteria bacterium]